MASTSTSPKHQKGLLELVKRENADLDIVAIHGLQGDAIQSWTHERTKFMWLTDYLPEQFPKARIFTYAYNSGVWFNGSTKTIEQESVNLLTYLDHKVEQDRPLIFICHSMGGILLKAAMVKANNERKKYGFLLEHPKVAVFMATPHGGSKIASCVDHLVKLPLPSSWFINKKHIKNLKSHSEELEEMSDNFDERKEEFRAILSFYETKPYPKVGSLVVQKHSANLHEGKLIGLDADHSTICKFESKMDTQLMMVVEELRRTVAKVLPSLNMPTTDLGSTHTPPQYKQQGLVYGIFGQVELEPLSSSPLPSSPLPTYRSTNSLTPNRYRGGWTPIASPSSSNTNLSLSSFNPPSLGESYPSTVIDDNAGSGSSRPSRSTPNIRNTYTETLTKARQVFQDARYTNSYKWYKALYEELKHGDCKTEVLTTILTYLGMARCFVRLYAAEEMEKRRLAATGDMTSDVEDIILHHQLVDLNSAAQIFRKLEKFLCFSPGFNNTRLVVLDTEEKVEVRLELEGVRADLIELDSCEGVDRLVCLVRTISDLV